MLAKLISSGQGSSGYYPPETLQKAAENNVFRRGTQMFWIDNATHGSGVEDPERLAAVLESDARYDPNGPDGEGLYADIMVFSDYAQKVAEKGEHLGLSIVGAGDVVEDELPNGSRGRVVRSITKGASVDFVTKAGRGGKLIFESVHNDGNETIIVESATTGENIMSEKLNEAATMLAEANSRIAELEAENTQLKRAQTAHMAESAATAVFDDAAYTVVPADMRKLFVRLALAESSDLSPETITAKVKEAADIYTKSAPKAGGVVGNTSQPATSEVDRLLESQAQALADKWGIDLTEAKKIVEGK